MRPLRILHVFRRMDRGGAELRTVELMNALDRSRFQFQFCTLSGLPGHLDSRIRKLDGEVFPCRLDAAFPARFLALLRRTKPDVVHSHVHLSSGLMLRLAALAGVSSRIAHFRSTGDGRPSDRIRRLQRAVMRRWIDAHATGVLAVSEAAMEGSWSEAWRSDPRCHVVYAGLDTRRFLDLPAPERIRRDLGFADHEKLCIHVGSMQPAKNHGRLMEIFTRVALDVPAARLLLVGRRDERIEAAIRNRARAEGLDERVTILGERDDVALLLRAADLMIFPSVREGLPGAVLEACAVGTPVVASDLPGIREIATRLPGPITILSLSDSDRAWAGAVVAELSAPRPRGAACPIAGTVFDIQSSVVRHCALWEGTRHEPS